MSDPQSTIIERIEAGIVKLLKTGMPSAFYIAPFPDDPKAFDSAKMKAAALVHYSGSAYSTDPNGQPVSQPREMKFTIQLYLHSLRDHQGGYGAIEAARKATQNISIEGATPFRMIADNLAEHAQGQWVWQLDLACAVPAVAVKTIREVRPRQPLMSFQETGS